MVGLVFALVLAAAAQEAESSDPMAALIADIDAAAAGVEADTAPIRCAGEHRQGAALICRTTPGADVSLGDVSVTAGEDGWVVLGHDRDAEPSTRLAVSAADSVWETVLDVAQRDYDIQRIEGVPQEYVSPPPETLERIRSESRVKAAAYTSLWETPGFSDGFVMPVDGGRITGVYGSQRYYNGEPRRPHYGVDIAVPGGTPVTAPASGVVTLADADMYFEGGLIFIDHGQGFTSAFLHLSQIDVEVGEVVSQGQQIGAVGSGGRSTGAHLDWRIKWRGRYIDPAAAVEVQAGQLR